MALLYPWATKEYLLWEMSIGQIILYHNYGIEIKNGIAPKEPGLLSKSSDELRAIRDEVRKRFQDEQDDNILEQMRMQYGDI